ncbi:MAG: phospholipase D-like domain-containing protein [Calditrichia bacterium]
MAHSREFPVFQLVQTVPIETILGHPRTQPTLSVWQNLIRSADSTIDMEFFYVSHQPGGVLQPIIDELKSAAQRGVQLRIVTDAKMARTYPETIVELNSQANISVKTISFYNRLGGVMHAKYFVVDNRWIFLGSQNMDWRALQHIHELGVVIQNHRLAGLFSEVFQMDWKLADLSESEFPERLKSIPEDLRITPQNPLILENTPFGRIELYPTFSPLKFSPSGLVGDEEALRQLLEQAEANVRIQLLSYKTVGNHQFYPVLDNALRGAAVRGVEVQMIVSNWNTRQPDIHFLQSLQIIPNISIAISSIPQWSGGFIPYARVEHCKFMLIDDERTWIGTSNWAHSYFHSSRNLGLVIQNGAVNQVVREIFEKSWNSSYWEELDPCKTYIPPQISGEEEK